MTDTDTAALLTATTALREASAALRIGEQAEGTQGRTADAEKPDLAAAVADLLDATIALLRTVDLDPVPTSRAGHDLHAVAQHVSAAAAVAHRAAGPVAPTPRTEQA